MMDVRLPNIGLCGYPNSGKSAVASILIDDFNYTLVDPKLPLRQEIGNRYGLDPDSLKEQSVKMMVFDGLTVRQHMGNYGLEMEQKYGPDYLILQAVKETAKLNSWPCVIDSLRMEQTLTIPVKVIEVKSKNSFKCEDVFNQFALPEAYYTIHNNGSFEDLRNDVLNLLQLIVDSNSFGNSY